MSEMGGMTTAQIRDLVGYAQALKQMGMEEDQIALELKRLQLNGAKNPTVKYSGGGNPRYSPGGSNPGDDTGELTEEDWADIIADIDRFVEAGGDIDDYLSYYASDYGFKKAADFEAALNVHRVQNNYSGGLPDSEFGKLVSAMQTIGGDEGGEEGDRAYYTAMQLLSTINAKYPDLNDRQRRILEDIMNTYKP
jgi:hypothetical protein